MLREARPLRRGSSNRPIGLDGEALPQNYCINIQCFAVSGQEKAPLAVIGGPQDTGIGFFSIFKDA
jgi:hypothetical protein